MIALYHYNQKFNEETIKDIENVNAILLLSDEEQTGYLLYNNRVSRLDMLHAKRIANSICRSGYALKNGKRMGAGYELVEKDDNKIDANIWENIFSLDGDKRNVFILELATEEEKSVSEQELSEEEDYKEKETQVQATKQSELSEQSKPDLSIQKSSADEAEETETVERADDWSEKTSFLPDNVKVETREKKQKKTPKVQQKTSEDVKVDVKNKMFEKIIDIFWVSLYGAIFKSWEDLPEDVRRKIKILTDGKQLPDRAVKELFYIRARNNKQDFKAKLRQYV